MPGSPACPNVPLTTGADMNELNNKVAIITGASSGIGRAAALRFAEEGARLVLADVGVEAGEALATELCGKGSEAIFVRTDVSKAPECEALVHAAVEKFGRLDAAFNNAGI